MSGLNITESARKTFKCPNCRQYISSDTCPKCSFQISNEIKGKLLDDYSKEVKAENRKGYMPSVVLGVVFLTAGLLLTIKSLFDNDFSPRGFGLIAVGAVGLFFGLRGLYRER